MSQSETIKDQIGEVIPALDISVDGYQTFQVSFISMGNPHGVVILECKKIFDSSFTRLVQTVGHSIENQSDGIFGTKVNVNFVEIIDRESVNVRTWERGSGETMACGTGSCAVVVVLQKKGLLEATVKVTTRGGSLSIMFDKNTNTVHMTLDLQI